MANEYRAYALSAEVWRQTTTAPVRLHATSVEVWRSQTSVASSTRRKQVMTGSF